LLIFSLKIATVHITATFPSTKDQGYACVCPCLQKSFASCFAWVQNVVSHFLG